MKEIATKQNVSKLLTLYFIEIDADFHRFLKPCVWFKAAYLGQMETKINISYIKISVSSLGIGNSSDFEDRQFSVNVISERKGRMRYKCTLSERSLQDLFKN